MQTLTLGFALFFFGSFALGEDSSAAKTSMWGGTKPSVGHARKSFLKGIFQPQASLQRTAGLADTFTTASTATS